jgi:cell division protein FtsI/penicillin-binding protein 2
LLGNPDKRIRWILLFFILVFSAVAVRTAFLTTVNAEELSQRIDMNHVQEVNTPAHRGTIFDRSGNELAVGVEAKTIIANPKLIKDPLRTASLLAPILKCETNTLLEQLEENSDSGFVYLARKIDPAIGDQVAQVVETEQLEGIDVQSEERRSYPQKQVAAQVIGFAGTDNSGLAGMELQLDPVLAGTEGRQRVITAADGNQIETVSLEEGTRGTDVYLTIDQAIQFETEKILTETVKQWSAKGAEAIVMNPRTGSMPWPMCPPST